MPDPKHAWPDNDPTPSVVGATTVWYYVDENCIACTVCSEVAPDHFRLADTEDHDICYRQPQTPTELECCEMAASECPAEAIGCEAGP